MDYMEEYWRRLQHETDKKQYELELSTEDAEKLRQRMKQYMYAERYGQPTRIRDRDFEKQTEVLTKYYQEAYIPKYIIGHDPYKEEEKKRDLTTINMDYESAEKSVFPKGLYEKLEKRKQELIKEQEKMKTKKFYHTFEYENREITLCLLVKEERQSQVDRLSGREATATIEVGYAVCVPEDRFDEKLAKRISSGRAESKKARLSEFSTRSTKEFAFDLGILNATARIFERRIKRGEVVIKGIR